MTKHFAFLSSDQQSENWPYRNWESTSHTQVDEQRDFPKITIVTPSYNQGAFIESTILSVARQNYPNFEYIVLDGGSTDDSVDVIRKHDHHISYWHSKRDRGQADALATGFEMASGDIYCWLNSDDMFLPGTLKYVAELLVRCENVNFVYGNRLVINGAGSVTGRHRWPYFLTKYHWHEGQPLAQECCFWRSKLYHDVGGIRRDRFFTMDYDLFYRMWLVGNFKKTSRYLACWRNHAESKNAKFQKIRTEEIESARREFDLVAPGYIASRILNYCGRLQSLIERS